jgi:hypothetical protein
MPLNLIADDESLTYKGDDFEIYYRRIPGRKRAEILKKNTGRFGAIDTGAASLAMMHYCITGWHGVHIRGEFVDFSKDLIEYIPDEILGEIAERAGANAPSDGADIKNSSTTSGSNPTTMH